MPGHKTLLEGIEGAAPLEQQPRYKSSKVPQSRSKKAIVSLAKAEEKPVENHSQRWHPKQRRRPIEPIFGTPGKTFSRERSHPSGKTGKNTLDWRWSDPLFGPWVAP
jgi:hypothetical protein